MDKMHKHLERLQKKNKIEERVCAAILGRIRINELIIDCGKRRHYEN